MYDADLYLLKMDISVNDYGDAVESISDNGGRRFVFCHPVSCSEKEKRLAESRGARAVITVKLPYAMEYEGELWAEYDGKKYAVIDTYKGENSEEMRLLLGLWEKR